MPMTTDLREEYDTLIKTKYNLKTNLYNILIGRLF